MSPPDTPLEDLVDFRLRVSRHLKDRVTKYAHTHPEPDAHGRSRPLSLNSAAVVLLEHALGEDDSGGAAGPRDTRDTAALPTGGDQLPSRS